MGKVDWRWDKIQMRKAVFKISLTILLLTLTVFVPASYAEKIKTIAVLPFKINAAPVLEKGLVKEKVAEFKGSLNKEIAINIGKALKADYVILGSLTVFGDSVSIDAKILDVNKEKELITAFNQSKGMDEVIPTVNKFAQDINAKIMGRYVRAPVYAKVPEEEEKVGPKGLIRVKESLQEKEIGHAQAFRTGIVGLDVGDVDGDGKSELVFIDSNTVYIHKWTENKFAEFRSIKGRWSPNYVYLSVADLDGNGRAEIYVSNLSESGLSSFVLEWQSGDFATIAKGQRWFFKVVDIPGKGKTLIGQSRITGGGFTRYIYILKREGDSFVKGERLRLPAMANIFNFTQGNIADKNEIQTLILSPETEFLFLFDENGEEIWRSDNEFGGIDTHMVVPGPDEGGERWIHFSSPIIVLDIDNDGLNEVVICKNKSSVGRITEKDRAFSSGKLHFLSWDKVDLATKWETKKMSGAITGYSLKDVDNDGNIEVVIAVALRSKSVVGRFRRSGRSQVVIYDLD
jgi:hypothetical protein